VSTARSDGNEKGGRMSHQIEAVVNRFTGAAVLDGISLKEILQLHVEWLAGTSAGVRAILSDSDLSGADLSRANLSRANLSRAILSCANLRRTNLRYADLRDADLRAADLSAADLSGANLRDADLRDADLRAADLSAADLSGATVGGATLDLNNVPKIPNIHRSVYAAAAELNALNMADWHSCGTTHCRGGWITTLAEDAGRALEERLGTPAAAALIYLASDPTLERIPDFYASSQAALADMKRLAEIEAA
jgi:hypothetical protein